MAHHRFNPPQIAIHRPAYAGGRMPHLPLHRSVALVAILSLLIAAVCAGGGLAAAFRLL